MTATTYIVTTILIAIFYLMGEAKAVCDGIMHHKAYDRKTNRMWHWDSFNLPKNIFGFVSNVWHWRDIRRNVLSMLALAIVVLFPPEINWLLLLAPCAFQVGFLLNYK